MELKRLPISILTGMFLGIFCIIGVSFRLGLQGNELFLLSTWMNRVILGIMIGLSPHLNAKNDLLKMLFRGALFGLIISGSFYIATGFKDTPGFSAGIVYGVIIEFVADRFGKLTVF